MPFLMDWPKLTTRVDEPWLIKVHGSLTEKLWIQKICNLYCVCRGACSKVIEEVWSFFNLPLYYLNLSASNMLWL